MSTPVPGSVKCKQTEYICVKCPKWLEVTEWLRFLIYRPAVTWGWFRSQLEASCVSSNNKESWKKQTARLYIYIYTYIHTGVGRNNGMTYYHNFETPIKPPNVFILCFFLFIIDFSFFYFTKILAFLQILSEEINQN